MSDDLQHYISSRGLTPSEFIVLAGQVQSAPDHNEEPVFNIYTLLISDDNVSRLDAGLLGRSVVSDNEPGIEQNVLPNGINPEGGK